MDSVTYDAEQLRSVWPPNQCEGWIYPDGESDLVSVVIPVYNRANLIEETLDSVWRQQYRPIEVIVIDDGSEDETYSVVQEWGRKYSCDDQFRVMCHRQENKGVAEARNQGILASNGEYIQLLDSDDRLHEEKIATQVEALTSNPQAAYTYCLTNYFGRRADGEEIIGCDIREDGIRKVVLGNPYQTSAALYRRDLMGRAGPFGANLAPADDWEFAVRAYIAARGEVLFQREVLNHQRADFHDRLTEQGRSFHEGRLKAMCHNAKVLREVGVFEDQWFSFLVGLNFLKLALHIDDLGGGRRIVRRAIIEGRKVSPLPFKLLFLVFEKSIQYKSLFEVLKNTSRYLSF